MARGPQGPRGNHFNAAANKWVIDNPLQEFAVAQPQINWADLVVRPGGVFAAELPKPRKRPAAMPVADVPDWARPAVPAPRPGEGDDFEIPGWDNDEENEDDEDRDPMVPVKKDKKAVKVRADYSTRAFSTKSTRLPAFRMAYEGADEMTLRLQGTVISAHDTMLYVNRIGVVRCDFSNDAGIGAECTFPDGSRRGVMFNPERTNLRSPDPGYIQIEDVAVYYHRIPARIYKQGINNENTVFYSVSGMRWSVFGAYAIETILTSFEERPIIQWQDVWPQGINTYRLSDRVALSRSGKTLDKLTTYAHYKGKQVGTLSDRVVTLDKHIQADFWMSRAFAAVGIIELKDK